MSGNGSLSLQEGARQKLQSMQTVGVNDDEVGIRMQMVQNQGEMALQTTSDPTSARENLQKIGRAVRKHPEAKVVKRVEARCRSGDDDQTGSAD